MPLAGVVLLIATGLTIAGLAVCFITIIVLLLRISSALSKASVDFGTASQQLQPVDSAVAKLTGSLAAMSNDR